MKLTRIISVIISLVMCMSMIMPSYSVIADETPIPSETTKTEEIEKPTKETEKKIPKETEETTSDTEKKEIESSQTDTQNKDTTKESECGSSSDNKTKEETEAKESETSEPTNETEVKESDAPEPQEPETTKETEVNSTDKDEPEISTESGPTSVARRTAKNITTSEIQSKLRTKMSQTGYVPGGKPPSSYVNGATCYGFVDALCRYLFNHGLPSQASSKYALVSSGTFSQVGSTLTYSAGKTSASNLKSLFQNCQPGDVVQMNYFSDKAASGSADYHTLMIYSVSDSGVVFYHAGSSKVWYGGLWTTSGSVFTWSSFASWFGEAGDGISVYRSKQSNGVALPSSTWINASCGSSTTTESNVTLTWGASNAASYWLHIYKDGVDYYNAGQEGRTSWSHTFTTAGTYTCYITPYGQSGYISSSEGPNACVMISVNTLGAPQISNFRVVNTFRDSEDERFTYLDFEATIVDPGSGIKSYCVYNKTDSRVEPENGIFWEYYQMANVNGNKITCRYKINTGKSITFCLYAGTSDDIPCKYNLATFEYVSPAKVMPTISGYQIVERGSDYVELVATITDHGNTGNTVNKKYYIGCTLGTVWNSKTSVEPICKYTLATVSGNIITCRVQIPSKQQYCLSLLCMYDWAGSFAMYDCCDIVVDFSVPVLNETIIIDNFEYVVTNANTDGTGTVTLTGVAVKKATVSIPNTVVINGISYKVNRIGTKAFYGNKTITSLVIGSNVVIIDTSAFYGCSNLTKVTGGKALKTIGSKAFGYCSKLKSFSISSTVLNKIGTYAFQKDKKLKTVSIKYTTKLTKSGVKKSLKSSSVKTVKVKKSKVKKYKKYFKKSNSGRSVKVKK